MSAAPISLGPVQLLASGRIARQVSINRSNEPVFIDKDGVTCCRHGERPATIQAWLNSERVDPKFARPSTCDCGNLDGLLTDYDLTAADLPTLSKDETLFELLGKMNADECKVNTRPQRLALRTGTSELWIQPKGTIVCKHGNSRKVIVRMMKGDAKRFRSSAVVKCACCLSIPRRVGSVLVSKNAHAAGE
jgi:hypothetical protein